MKRITKGILLTALLTGCVLTGCKQGNVFQINGTIQDAAEDTLYLEHRGLAGTELIDAAILKKDGACFSNNRHPKIRNFTSCAWVTR